MWGQWLRELRQFRNLTQAELAEHAQTTQASISDVERGTVQTPGTALLQRLARALEVSEQDLRGALFANIQPSVLMTTGPAPVFEIPAGTRPTDGRYKPMKRSTRHATRSQDSVLPTWEYLKLGLDHTTAGNGHERVRFVNDREQSEGLGGESVSDYLTQLGEQGWELVTSIQCGRPILLFKRAKDPHAVQQTHTEL